MVDQHLSVCQISSLNKKVKLTNKSEDKITAVLSQLLTLSLRQLKISPRKNAQIPPFPLLSYSYLVCPSQC